jgi:RNA-binding protein 26
MLNVSQGFAKGTNVPTVGQVQVSWHTDQPSISRQQSQQPPTLVTGKTEVKVANPTPSATHDAHGVQEEEAVASGWGDDGEDGMGML